MNDPVTWGGLLKAYGIYAGGSLVFWLLVLAATFAHHWFKERP